VRSRPRGRRAACLTVGAACLVVGACGEPDTTDSEPVADNEVVFGPSLIGEGAAHLFGSVPVGGQRTMSFVVSSERDAHIVGESAIVGPAAGDYRLNTGSCTVGVELGRDRRCVLYVTFAPTRTGARTATLSLDVRPHAVANDGLHGIGVAR
jgi:hypothetical protein